MDQDAQQKSLLDEIHSLSPYFPYKSERPEGQEGNGDSSSSHASEVSSNWTARRRELMERANDYEVVNRQSHHIPPYPEEVGESHAAEGGSIGISTALMGDQVTQGLQSHPSVVLPWSNPELKADIVRIISQWLADEGFGATRQTLLEEAGVKRREREDTTSEFRKLKGYILEGNWPEVDKLCAKPFMKNEKALLYAIFKQQFLEHIEHREFQKAFTFLNKRLKPLEHYQPHAAEFGDLCYLLSAKSVTDAPSFRSWEGIQPARESLIADFSSVLDQGRGERESTLPGAGSSGSPSENGLMAYSSADSAKLASSQDLSDAPAKGNAFVPPHRLLRLLHQAVAYQVEFARYQSRKVPVVSSLLQDYSGYVIPNHCHMTMRGHSQNVKCVRFVGEDGRRLISGSSDSTARLWDTESGRCEAVFEGHHSRIWDVDSTITGSFVASASGDSTVKLWSTESKLCQHTLHGGTGDIYCCRFSPDQGQLVAGGYDKLVRLYDLGTGTTVRMFPGHQLGVSSAAWSPLGNVIATGAKDTSIRFWDTLTGLCIRTLPGHLGEVTSVEMSEDGLQLLTSSKDNSIRLWDMRMLRPLRRFKGHQNTSKNFIRSAFAHPSLLVSGSEDGLVYIWDQESSNVVQTLEGHGVETHSASQTAPMAVNTHLPSQLLPPAHGRGWSQPHNPLLDDVRSVPPGATLRPVENSMAERSERLSYNTRMQVVVYGAVWNKAQSLLASCADDGTVRLWDWNPHWRREE